MGTKLDIYVFIVRSFCLLLLFSDLMTKVTYTSNISDSLCGLVYGV